MTLTFRIGSTHYTFISSQSKSEENVRRTRGEALKHLLLRSSLNCFFQSPDHVLQSASALEIAVPRRSRLISRNSTQGDERSHISPFTLTISAILTKDRPDRLCITCTDHSSSSESLPGDLSSVGLSCHGFIFAAAQVPW